MTGLVDFEGYIGKLFLILVYVALIVVVSFRVSVHPTHYTTPDSIAYLKHSQHIKKEIDKGTFSFQEIKSDFTIWPIGYPLSIAVMSCLSEISLLVSSKMVNLIFLGLLFFILYLLFGNNSWFTALPFLSYGSLEVVSETWSETSFIFFVLLLCYIVAKDTSYNSLQLGFGMATCLICLFLFRYVGIVYFIMVSIIAVGHYFSGKINLACTYLVALLISGIFIAWYLYDNFHSSGFLTGGERVVFGRESPLELLKLLVQGLLNEFSIARNYFFKSDFPDYLFITLMTLQLLAIAILVKNRRYLKFPINVT